jgi:hypothetical protein
MKGRLQHSPKATAAGYGGVFLWETCARAAPTFDDLRFHRRHAVVSLPD